MPLFLATYFYGFKPGSGFGIRTVNEADTSLLLLAFLESAREDRR